jgi:hypothetical protein
MDSPLKLPANPKQHLGEYLEIGCLLFVVIAVCSWLMNSDGGARRIEVHISGADGFFS